MMKKLFSLASFLAFFGIAQGQTTIDISQLDNYNIWGCFPLTITGQNYENATSESISFTIDEDVEGIITATVNPSYFDAIWDVDPTAELKFYGSANEDVPFLGSFNSESHPDGFMLQIEQNEFRIEFESFEGSSGLGFELELICENTLADMPRILFEPTQNESWFYDEVTGTEGYFACDESSKSYSVNPIFLFPEPNLAELETVLIKWAMGDTTYRGMGLTEIEHTYNSGHGQKATFYAADTAGHEVYIPLLIKNSPRPNFSIDQDQIVCELSTVQIDGGMDGSTVIGAQASSSGVAITEFFGTELFLPDGNDTNYETSIEVSGFPIGTLLTEEAGLNALCTHIEHSYLGDLEMMLTCPDGTNINVFNSFTGDGLFQDGFGGGGTYLGDANDDSSIDPGIGFDYCFTDDAEFGILAYEYAAGNTIPTSTFQNGNAMTPGFYMPEDALTSLAGCPANGTWTITIRDNLMVDNGWLFDWSLGFNIELSPETSEYQNELIDATWQEHPWITGVSEESIEITPNENNDPLIFQVTDEAGCVFEHEVFVEVISNPEDIIESGVCDLHAELPWTYDFGDINFISGPDSNYGSVSFDTYTIISVNEPGNYIFEYYDEDCGFSATAEIEFLPLDHEDCVTGINEIHKNRSLQIIPNPSSGDVQLNLGLEKEAFAEVSIITMDGRLVMQEQFRFTRGEYVNLSTHELPSGTYIISIQGDTFGATELFIKN